MAQPKTRCRMLCQGVVQGVGFRPFVYRTAVALDLAGTVQNTPAGVVIEVEGARAAIAELQRRLREEAPPLAKVTAIEENWDAPAGLRDFRILTSAAGASSATLIPADVAVCPACLAEMNDEHDRRHRYPFINCTDCGPRFTIIQGVPYDRAKTTMRVFPLCPACRAEYEDPRTRRFHAEPNACPTCGPRVWLADSQARAVDSPDPIHDTAEHLAVGEIIAVKGVGGFHLAVDAANAQAVARLRHVKGRDRKPFAIMVADLAGARRLAQLTDREAALLEDPARPIVLVRRREVTEGPPLAAEVAPVVGTVGLMLPYAPLHHLLLGELAGLGVPAIVLTSANPHDEPIARDNEEAFARLKAIADGYLFHDRPILARADDSVTMDFGGRPLPVRRSRGYTPAPVRMPAAGPSVLAVGGDLKNSFVVTRGDEAFFGPHVGDMENAATAAYFEEAVGHLCALLDVGPKIVAHDAHPDYASTRAARRLAHRFHARLVAVQHHHAHILSCLAENAASGAALGVAIDGTGHGLDGTLWGGEILAVRGADCERMAHLATLPLPGGDRAVREPWRIAAAALIEHGAGDLVGKLADRWRAARPDLLAAVVKMAAERRPMPRTSALGRLCDAIAAIAGVCDEVSYEGEAAIRLEEAASSVGEAEPYPVRLSGALGDTIETRELLRAAARDALGGVPAGQIAARFHAAVVTGLADAVLAGKVRTGLGTVAISGGAAQNRLFVAGLQIRLGGAGLRVLTHSQVPANDGGLALGQAVAALSSE
jgi:hydrogenase maturation protein HypF